MSVVGAQGAWQEAVGGYISRGIPMRGGNRESRMRNSKIDKRNIEIATMTNCNVVLAVRKRGAMLRGKRRAMHSHLTETNGEREGHSGWKGAARSAARASLAHRHLNITKDCCRCYRCYRCT